jgi:UDP-N-acetylmuramate dehydrogenase
MIHILENESLKKYTTFGLGGNALFFITLSSLDDLKEALLFAKEKNLPFHILGKGSNTVFKDEVYKGVILHPLFLGVSYTKKENDTVLVSAGAGEEWDSFVEKMVEKDFWGLENLSYIPGSVGASPVQNIACYGVSVSESIESVEVFDTDTYTSCVFSKEECCFGYRDSFFKTEKGKKYIITKVHFLLKTKGNVNTSYSEKKKSGYKDLSKYFENKKGAPTLKEIRMALKEIRESKFPDIKKVGTAGSFFKNPIILKKNIKKIEEKLKTPLVWYEYNDDYATVPAGFILEALGFRGYRKGNVGTWKNHALALVHYGNGTAEELLSLASFLEKEVKRKTGIILEKEVCIIPS